MPLLILVLIAGVVGYFLAKSRFSQPIDRTADRLANTSRGMADKVEDSVSGLFRRGRKSSTTIIEGQAQDAPPPAESPTEPVTPPAEKQPSRRQSQTDTGLKKE